MPIGSAPVARARKSAALHRLAGTRSRSASGAVELPPSDGAPPVGLSSRELVLWTRVVPPLATLGVYSIADVELMRLAVEALAEREAAREVLDADGMTYVARTDRGGEAIRPRPEVRIAEDAARRAQRILDSFSRRVQVKPAPPQDSNFAKWQARRAARHRGEAR